MRFFRSFILSILLVFYSFNTYGGTISSELEEFISHAGEEELIPVILKFKTFKLRIDESKKKSRRDFVKTLRLEHEKLKDKIKNTFRNLGIKRVNDLWHIGGFSFSVKPETIRKLSNLYDDAEIKLDRVIDLPSFEITSENVNEWNINLIGAPDLWKLNIKGQGVSVANLDTGVDYSHPDLFNRWRGGSNSWFDPYGIYSQPHDVNGHGTGTMGIIVGGNFSGTSIGIAPESKWIAAKIFDDSGKAQISKIHQAFGWLLDPDGNPDTDDAPHIVNNSWGFIEVNQCDNEFQDDIEILNNADIAVVFSAGNSGPEKPSNSSPANNRSSFSVGSIDSNLNISNFSSRGPSACTNDIFPNVVAPGSYIKTADLFLNGARQNPYAIVSGTSFAAPHVAGALALLKSAFPEKPIRELIDALKMTAIDLGESGPDNDYGSGLINVKNAYNYIANLPELASDKNSYTFPKTIVNNHSSEVVFNVKNNGYGPLYINGVRLTDNINFLVTYDGCTGVTLNSKEICSMGVIFNPTITGTIESNLVILSNDPLIPEKIINLLGFGILEKLKILSPNGGESLTTGNTIEIKWAGTADTVFYTIQLSKDGGFTWSNIAKFVTGYSYSWTIPPDIYNRTKCLIRILGYNYNKRYIAKDISDAFFSLISVKLNIPANGDIIINGSKLRISWDTYQLISSVNRVEIYFTSNGGLSWKKIGQVEGNPGFYDWEVMYKPSAKCYVKIVLRDIDNRIIGLVKNSLPFSII